MLVKGVPGDKLFETYRNKEYFLSFSPDKPDEPTRLHKVLCVMDSATISWTAGDVNNDEIIEYIVYYNTSYDDPRVFHEATKVPGPETDRCGSCPGYGLATV